jgi:uncharacterized Zn-binding protein involved in type VI secretion
MKNKNNKYIITAVMLLCNLIISNAQKPAARMGDQTAHGGVIVMGCSSVLICGMPAARVGDMHTCPMITPGIPPVPHVGGPILPPGSPTVLIGGMPAARMGDMASCVGPPDVIMMGCSTVLIGLGAGSVSAGMDSLQANFAPSADTYPPLKIAKP